MTQLDSISHPALQAKALRGVALSVDSRGEVFAVVGRDAQLTHARAERWFGMPLDISRSEPVVLLKPEVFDELCKRAGVVREQESTKET